MGGCCCCFCCSGVFFFLSLLLLLSSLLLLLLWRCSSEGDSCFYCGYRSFTAAGPRYPRLTQTFYVSFAHQARAAPLHRSNVVTGKSQRPTRTRTPVRERSRGPMLGRMFSGAC